MLCPAFAFLYPSRKERLSSLATLLGIAGRGNRGKVVNLLAGLDELKQEVGIPLAIKETGQDKGQFQAKLDPIADSYMNNIGRGIAGLPPEVRRTIGLPISAAEVKGLLMHAWNGTRAELR